MDNFESLGLSEELNKSLAKLKYTKPTPIQAQAIPIALKGHDVLGSAQTGTGKTAAFSIPLVEALINDTKACGLILTPTRELAKQVLEAVHELLGPKSPIKTAFIIGGAAMSKQNQELRRNPRIIVGTPGRINDHLERGSIKLDRTKFLVLDETDRMLDMGFGVQLDRIVKYLPQERQTLMFSATLPKEIIKVSDKYLTNPQRVSVGQTNVVAVNIKQEVVKIEQSEKYKELVNQLYDRTGSVIVFIKTKHGADRMAKNLRRDGFTSEALHGDLKQNRRDKVMKNFHDKNFRILIATDIAARGLDVPHIEHVINYDLPQVAEDYIHRMGRTARAGATGSALSFVSNQDGRKWHAIEILLNPELAKQGHKNDQGKPSRGRNRPMRRGKSNANKSGSYAGKKPGARAGEKSSDKFKSRKKSNDRKFDKREDGEKKPYKKKSYTKDDGEQKSYKKKPYNKDEGGDKPYKKKPYNKDEGGDKPYKKKPYRKGDSDQKSEGSKKFGGKKPYGKKSNDDKPSGKKFDGSKPLKKKTNKDDEGSFKGKKSFSKKKSSSNFAGKKPFSKQKPKQGSKQNSGSNKKFKKA